MNRVWSHVNPLKRYEQCVHPGPVEFISHAMHTKSEEHTGQHNLSTRETIPSNIQRLHSYQDKKKQSIK